MMNSSTGEIKVVKEWKKSLFHWSINNFDQIFDLKHTTGCTMLKSPNFSLNCDDGLSQNLIWHIFLSRRVDELDLIVSLPMSLAENRGHLFQGIKSKFTIGLGNTTNLFLVNKPGEHIFTEEADYYTIPLVVKISDLYKYHNDLLNDNTLQVGFQLEVEIDLVGVNSPELLKRKQVSIVNKFFTDFAGLRHVQKHSDLEIKCGGQSFFCHKAILSIRSSVFDQMFVDEIDDVSIDDMEYASVSAILHYIYTGKVDVLPGPCSWVDLIHGADKYDLQDLKNYCFERLFMSLTDTNAGTLALIAHNYKADVDTQRIAKEYCQANIATLMKDPSFRQIFVKYPSAFYQD